MGEKLGAFKEIFCLLLMPRHEEIEATEWREREREKDCRFTFNAAFLAAKKQEEAGVFSPSFLPSRTTTHKRT